MGDEESLVDRFSNGLIGLDPGDLLIDPCPLRAENLPRRPGLALKSNDCLNRAGTGPDSPIHQHRNETPLPEPCLPGPGGIRRLPPAADRNPSRHGEGEIIEGRCGQ